MVRERIEKILKKVADTEDLRNYGINVNIDSLRGDGFLSDFYTGEVTDKNTGKAIQVYIKFPPASDAFSEEFRAAIFSNECTFCSSIFTELNKFQIGKGVKNPFKNITKFYSVSDKLDEHVAMENLKAQNYILYDKMQFINEYHLRAIFKAYGRFHALTFAYKDQNSEKYPELIEPFIDIFDNTNPKISGVFYRGTKASFKHAYLVMKDIDSKIAEKIEPYAENFDETHAKAMKYNGKYSAFTHGDCWSNNLLFKYKDDGAIEDIKLIDFQLCRNSTPVHDLSYFFYSGASAEDFKKLDEYLELYHASFSAFAKELGSDPEKLLPLSVLKSEWKRHSKFGVLLAIFLWSLKLIEKEKIQDITASRESDAELSAAEKFQKNMFRTFQSDGFKKNTSDILMHAVEYEIL